MSNVPAEGGRQRNERPETARVFFALWPPPEVARQLSAVADSFAQCAGGRATRQATVHLTLAFIGDVPLERLPDLERAARNVRAEAFDLTLDQFGLWHHNRIFWAGCSVVPPALVELASALSAALQAAGFEVADARRTLHPACDPGAQGEGARCAIAARPDAALAVHEIRAGAVAIVGQRRFLPDACRVLLKRRS